MKNIPVIAFVLITTAAFAGENSVVFSGGKKYAFAKMRKPMYSGPEQNIGIMFEARGMRSRAFGGGFTFSSISWGCYGGTSAGVSVSCMYDVDAKATIPSIDAWVNPVMIMVGPELRFKAQYIGHRDYSAFALQPQAGIGFAYLHLLWGYNFYINKPEAVYLPKNTITLWFFIPAVDVGEEPERLKGFD